MITSIIMVNRFNRTNAIIALRIIAWSFACCWAACSHGATIVAAGDSFIRGGTSSGTNYGTSSNITVKYTNSVTDTSRIGYLFFELGALTEPIGSASLNLTTTTNDADGLIPWTVQIYALANESLDDWVESGEGSITWQNSPGHDANSSGFNSDAIYLGDLSVPVGVNETTFSFSNEALVDFLNADTDGRVTFMVTRTSTPSSGFNLGFASRENSVVSFRPTLTYEAVPEPGRMAFWGLAGSALLVVRHRGC